MRKPNRRDFIALTAATAAAAAGMSGPQAGRAAAAEARRAPVGETAATGTLKDAKHIVILMQENRSFDHYFGLLKGVRGFSDRSTVELAGGHGVFDQPNGTGRHYPWQLSATQAAGGADPERLAQCSGDLAHDWASQHAAWNHGRMDSWVSAKGLRSLGYLTREDIPFHYALADTWTVCDAYHASGMSATGPNRTYLWSGRISEASKDGGSESGLTWETYAEALEKAAVSWKVYQSTDNYGDNALAYFAQFASAPAGSPCGARACPRSPGAPPSPAMWPPTSVTRSPPTYGRARCRRCHGSSPTRTTPSTPWRHRPTAPTSSTRSSTLSTPTPTSSTPPSSSSTTTRTTATSTTFRRPPRRPAQRTSSSAGRASASASVYR